MNLIYNLQVQGSFPRLAMITAIAAGEAFL
jgi:hypothetical protein